jgi:hypothetical protein
VPGDLVAGLIVQLLRNRRIPGRRSGARGHAHLGRRRSSPRSRRRHRSFDAPLVAAVPIAEQLGLWHGFLPKRRIARSSDTNDAAALALATVAAYVRRKLAG